MAARAAVRAVTLGLDEPRGARPPVRPVPERYDIVDGKSLRRVVTTG